jgi:hypothetical protein
MSLHPNEVLLAPVVSEKSYSLIEDRKYSFRVHKDAHKTQVRQAVEELFGVKVVSVNMDQGPVEAEDAELPQGHAPRLEEGDRPAEGGRRDRDLRGGSGLMALKKFKPTSPGPRFMTVSGFEEVTRSKPEKSLTSSTRRRAGRNNKGRITTAPQGRRAQAPLPRDRLQADEGRRAGQGRSDRVRPEPLGEHRAAPLRGRREGVHPRPGPAQGRRERRVGPNADIKPGNALPLENIPTGTLVHNVELKPGRGGQMARSAGSGIQLVAKDEGTASCASPRESCAACCSRAARPSVRSATSTTRTSPAARRAAAGGAASARPCAAPR